MQFQARGSASSDSRAGRFRQSASGLGALTGQMVGEAMAPSIERIRRFGERYDELDAREGGRMREYLGRSISEQFGHDLAVAACRFAVSGGKVAPEALALINGALGLSLDEDALRERSRSTSATGAVGQKTAQAARLLGSVVTSGFCNCEICNGKWAYGPTASGVMPTANHTVAVDRFHPIVPMGTKVVMNGIEYTVEDTGNFARFGVAFDVYYDSHSVAQQHGRQTWEAYIVDGADEIGGGRSARAADASQPSSAADDTFFNVLPRSFIAAAAYDNRLYAETGNPDESCAELLLMNLKTLCEEVLACNGAITDDEAAHFTALMRSIQNHLVENLDSWEGKPRISALALSPSCGDAQTSSTLAGGGL